MKIKPGFFSIFFKKFSLQSVIDYFNDIKDIPKKNLTSIIKRSSKSIKINPDLTLNNSLQNISDKKAIVYLDQPKIDSLILQREFLDRKFMSSESSIVLE